MRRRGFSLAELMVAMLLMAMLMGLGMLRTRQGGAGAHPRAMASEIVSELRFAQARALASQTPVAVIFPSDDGARPTSSGLYLAQGTSGARVTERVDYAGRYSEAVAFVGTWPLGGGLTDSVTPPAGKGLVTPLDDWLTAEMKKDYCLIFCPNGSVLSNGLPIFGGAYHVVVANGLQVQAGAAPPGTAPISVRPADFALTAVGKCYTITCTATGTISMEAGLSGQDGSIPLQDQVALPQAAAPPSVPAAPSAAPVLVNMTLAPSPDPATLPAGADIVAIPGGYFSITTTARDPGNSDLYISWSADGGTFSNAGETRMDWDPVQRVWTSTWQWQAPPNAAPPIHYHLTCSIRNSLNASASIPSSQTREVEIVPPGTIAFLSMWKDPVQGVSPNVDSIWSMTGKGAGLHEIVPCALNQGYPPFFNTSTLGSTMICVLGQMGAWDGVPVLRVADREGKVLTRFGAFGSLLPSISPYGNKVAYWGFQAGGTRLFVSYADGSNVQSVYLDTHNPFVWHVPGWSPDQRYLVINCDSTDATMTFATVGNVMASSSSMGTTPGGVSLQVVKADGSAPPVDLHVHAVGGCFSPDPADMWVYYADGVDGEIYKIRPDGSSVTKITNFAGSPRVIDVSSLNPQGTKVLYTAKQGATYQLFSYDLATSEVKQVTSGARGGQYSGGMMGSWSL